MAMGNVELKQDCYSNACRYEDKKNKTNRGRMQEENNEYEQMYNMGLTVAWGYCPPGSLLSETVEKLYL